MDIGMKPTARMQLLTKRTVLASSMVLLGFMVPWTSAYAACEPVDADGNVPPPVFAPPPAPGTQAPAAAPEQAPSLTGDANIGSDEALEAGASAVSVLPDVCSVATDANNDDLVWVLNNSDTGQVDSDGVQFQLSFSGDAQQLSIVADSGASEGLRTVQLFIAEEGQLDQRTAAVSFSIDIVAGSVDVAPPVVDDPVEPPVAPEEPSAPPEVPAVPEEPSVPPVAEAPAAPEEAPADPVAPPEAPAAPEEAPADPVVPPEAPATPEEAPADPVVPPEAPATPEEAPADPVEPPEAPATPEEAPADPVVPPEAPATPEEAPADPVVPPEAPATPEEAPANPVAPPEAPAPAEEAPADPVEPPEAPATPEEAPADPVAPPEAPATPEEAPADPSVQPEPEAPATPEEAPADPSAPPVAEGPATPEEAPLDPSVPADVPDASVPETVEVPEAPVGTEPPATITDTAPIALEVVTESSNLITLQWQPGEGFASTGYNVYRNGSYLATVSDSNFADTQVDQGNIYYYAVAAFNANGDITSQSDTLITSATNDSTPAQLSPPVAPPALIIRQLVDELGVLLTWAAGSDDVGVEGYNVYRDGSYVGTSMGQLFIDRTASSDTHRYHIVAFDGDGNFSRINSSTARTLASGVANSAISNLYIDGVEAINSAVAEPLWLVNTSSRIIIVQSEAGAVALWAAGNSAPATSVAFPSTEGNLRIHVVDRDAAEDDFVVLMDIDVNETASRVLLIGDDQLLAE